MTAAESATTRFCARVIGPIILIVGAVVLARLNDLVMMVPAILQDGPLAFITGIFTLICGMVLFAAHHHFGSAAAIVITVLGGLTVVRGISLLLAPDIIASFANTLLIYSPGAMIAGGIAVIIGAYLTYTGWFSKSAV